MWTAEQTTALVEKLRRENDEFAEWTARVLAGKERLEGADRDAYRAGFSAGRRRASEDDRADATALYSARERVAYSAGYGEGRALPAIDGPTGPNLDDLLRRRP